MRCSQPQGLPSEALIFLRENVITKDVCPTCRGNSGFKQEVIGTCGIFDDVDLFSYELQDGGLAREFVQHCVWYSGPMEWFGLKVFDSEGNLASEILWDEADLKY